MLLRLSEVFRRRAGIPEIIILGVFYAMIMAVMMFVFIPDMFRELPGMTIFDLRSTGYDEAYVTAVRDGLSARGLGIYTKLQLPLDFVFPLVYGMFYLAFGNKLFGKIHLPLFASVLALCVVDYTENSMSYYLLLAQELNPTAVAFASTMTMIKTVLLWVVSLLLITGIAVAVRRRKTKNNPEN